MRLSDANGTTKIINLTTNVAALAVYLINGKVLLPLGLTAGLFNIAGNYLGSKSFSKNGSKIARPVMIIVCNIFYKNNIRACINEKSVYFGKYADFLLAFLILRRCKCKTLSYAMGVNVIYYASVRKLCALI
jgi:hypothetical protein